jgi:hypothetical protein
MFNDFLNRVVLAFTVVFVTTASVCHAVEVNLERRDGKTYYRTDRSGLDRDAAEVQALLSLAFSKTPLDLSSAVASSLSLRGAGTTADARKSELREKPLAVLNTPTEKRRKTIVDHYVREVREIDTPVYIDVEVDVHSASDTGLAE